MVNAKLSSGTSANSEDVNDASGLIAVEAAENITAGNIVYIHLTDGKAYISDTGTSNDIRANGVAMTTAALGADVEILTRGVYTTTGLTDKADYYLGAAGAISTTLSGVRIGTALSTTKLYVQIVQDDRDSIGTIKSYLADFTNLPSNNLSAFWVLCDGTSLSDAESILNGQTIPDLNGNNNFVRAADTSGGTGGTTAHNHQTMQQTSGGSRLISAADDGGASSVLRGAYASNGTAQNWGSTSGKLDNDQYTSNADGSPPYYDVVFIMKVK